MPLASAGPAATVAIVAGRDVASHSTERTAVAPTGLRPGAGGGWELRSITAVPNRHGPPSARLVDFRSWTVRGDGGGGVEWSAHLSATAVASPWADDRTTD